MYSLLVVVLIMHIAIAIHCKVSSYFCVKQGIIHGIFW